MKTWRCTVCGYLHEGEAPPEFCPVCHADASKFVLVTETLEAEPSAPIPDKLRGLFREMLDVFVPHAVAAHFPNALIPTLTLFLLLFLASGNVSLETAAYYLLWVVFLAVPTTIVTGLYDWKTLYAAAPAPIFRRKIILAVLLLILTISAVFWRWQQPQLLQQGGWSRVVFVVLVAAMLVCVTLLGHYGGMLVFGRNKKNN